MSKEEPQVEWSLGMMRTLVYYTASSTWETIATLQRGKHMARIMPSTHNFGSKSSKRAFQKFSEVFLSLEESRKQKSFYITSTDFRGIITEL